MAKRRSERSRSHLSTRRTTRGLGDGLSEVMLARLKRVVIDDFASFSSTTTRNMCVACCLVGIVIARPSPSATRSDRRRDQQERSQASRCNVSSSSDRVGVLAVLRAPRLTGDFQMSFETWDVPHCEVTGETRAQRACRAQSSPVDRSFLCVLHARGLRARGRTRTIARHHTLGTFHRSLVAGPTLPFPEHGPHGLDRRQAGCLRAASFRRSGGLSHPQVGESPCWHIRCVAHDPCIVANQAFSECSWASYFSLPLPR